MVTRVLISYFFLFLSGVQSAGILYPHASETRELLPLNGLWNFALTNSTEPSVRLDLQKMPVPASYNDLGTNRDMRDHVGPVWYSRNFFVPKSWSGQKVWIRFSSVCRAAEVSVNDESVVSHDIGHLPFQAEISSLLRYGSENTVAVTVDNTLSSITIPQGSLSTLVSGRIRQNYNFDFFNYAGIDRPVVLYTTPNTYIDDITVLTDVDGTDGIVNYTVTVEGSDAESVKISLVDKNGNEVASDTDLEGTLVVKKASLWWPYLMDPNPGYLYSFKIELYDSSGDLLDKYVLPVGIRSITWDSSSLKINNKPVYLRGFSRHEDSDFRGKGVDLPLIIRDHNLIRWIGANSYRTSHYPYAEEIMDLADEIGLMIVDESPAVQTTKFSDKLLANHKQSLTELIQRDKNRPGVIMWSAAHEPESTDEASEDYFRDVVAHIKSLDTSRPVTITSNLNPDKEHALQFVDIASYDIYNAWNSETGAIDIITLKASKYLKLVHKRHNIPVLVTEYGADAQEGFHILPTFAWSEDFQDEFLSHYFQVFDTLRDEGYLIGEMIFNFADFKTPQNTKRVGGSKRGIFTRNRQPKTSAYLLRRRYWALAERLDNITTPADVEAYVISISSVVKDEL